MSRADRPLTVSNPSRRRKRTEYAVLGNSRVTFVGLIIAIFGVAFLFGGHPVIDGMLLLLAWVLMMLDEDMRSG
jgi:hypothetical protein